MIAGNGAIKGNILIFRSPCNRPGAIQKAVAVVNKNGYPYSSFRGAVLFSAKGERLLADMLSGGDLDGDEYYTIVDPLLIDATHTSEPHDYISKKDNVQRLIDLQRVFLTHKYLSESVPAINDQLEVFRQLMRLGNVASDSAEAWIRDVDSDGADSQASMAMADLHERAIDERKVSLKLKLQEL